MRRLCDRILERKSFHCSSLLRSKPAMRKMSGSKEGARFCPADNTCWILDCFDPVFNTFFNSYERPAETAFSIHASQTMAIKGLFSAVESRTGIFSFVYNNISFTGSWWCCSCINRWRNNLTRLCINLTNVCCWCTDTDTLQWTGPPTTAVIADMEKFESGYALFLLIMVLSMFGLNTAVAIEAFVSPIAFFSYKVFTGAAYLSGTAVMLYLKTI